MIFSVVSARLRLAAVAAVAGVTLTGCSANVVAATPTPVDYKACLISTSAGFSDGAANQAAYFGLQQAMVQNGTAISVVETTSDSAATVTRAGKKLVSRGCKLVMATGAYGQDGLVPLALGNPGVTFATLGGNNVSATLGDGSTADPNLPKNFLAFNFDERSAYIQAGYLAAASSASGKVAVLGATDALSRNAIYYFRQGVYQYIEKHQTTVAIVGADRAEANTWNLIASDSSPALVQAHVRKLLAQGADVVLPVGINGFAAAQVAQELGANVVGSDSDWSKSARFATVKASVLASVVPNLADAVSYAVTRYQCAATGGNDCAAMLFDTSVQLQQGDSAKWPDGASDQLNQLAKDYAAGSLSVVEDTATK